MVADGFDVTVGEDVGVAVGLRVGPGVTVAVGGAVGETVILDTDVTVELIFGTGTIIWPGKNRTFSHGNATWSQVSFV